MIEEHYKTNYNKYLKYCMRKLSGDRSLSEDVVQETYTRALKYFDMFVGEDKIQFHSWMNAILNNTLKSMKKQERLRGIVKDIDSYQEVLSYELDENKFEEKTFLKLLNHELQFEKEVTQKILHLYFNLGFMPSEIIKSIPGVGLEAVKKLVQRFKNNLLTKYALV